MRRQLGAQALTVVYIFICVSSDLMQSSHLHAFEAHPCGITVPYSLSTMCLMRCMPESHRPILPDDPERHRMAKILIDIKPACVMGIPVTIPCVAPSVRAIPLCSQHNLMLLIARMPPDPPYAPANNLEMNGHASITSHSSMR